MVGLPAQVQQADDRAAELMKGDDEAHKDEHLTDSDKSTPAQPDLQKKYDDLVKAHEVLQGKYKSEIEALKEDVGLVQRLKNDVKTLRRDLTERDELLAQVSKQLEEQKTEPQPAAAPKALDLSTVLSKEEQEYIQEEELGDKFLQIVTKVATAIVQSQQAPDYSGQFKQLEERINKTDEKVEKSNISATETYMRSQLPNYDKYFGDHEGVDPKWVEWLNSPVSEYDPKRLNRHSLLDLQRAGKHDLVIKAIKDFEARQAAANASAEDEKKRSDAGLEAEVEPEETGSENIDTTQGEPRSYDEVWVKQFYKDVALGKWAGRDKERAKIEKDIYHAGMSGRIK